MSAPLKIAIQGIKGCNHDVAANRYFEGTPVQSIDCSSFSELAEKVEKEGILGIMAIENTIAGSILSNYKLLRDHHLKIIGECKLRIKHALAAMEGTRIEDITEINSHPIALMQCSDFIRTLNQPKVVEKEDTAGAAKWIMDNRLASHAAICPADAAKRYGLNILADGIETNKRNFTRFLIVSAAANVWNGEINKSSLVFTLPHSSGSLSQVLSILSFYRMNLTMIQSLPIIGKEWEYQFYINLLFEDYKTYTQAIDAIRPLTSELEILGEYKKGPQWNL